MGVGWGVNLTQIDKMTCSVLVLMGECPQKSYLEIQIQIQIRLTFVRHSDSLLAMISLSLDI